MPWNALRYAFVVTVLTAGAALRANEPLTAIIATPRAPGTEGFNLGTARNPEGATLTVDTYSLRLNGTPWIPVMGEFHYSRYPAAEWRQELLKMKAGGIDIVATYVFWIHHEEIEGRFDWAGQRSLRQFIQTAGQVGLKAVVRCGPWCHGEVRNGGLPDWILQKGWQVRSSDPNYLARVRILYQEIAAQLQGLLWKDGGPVIGIQLENEYSGPAEHLMSLKRIAREASLDAPLYTRTGWPRMQGQLPFGEILPLFGVYAEGFWDRDITAMPGNYRAGFHFTTLRTDSAIATDQLGERAARDEAEVARYPYLTCEIGGGMMNSYHRRILINPADVESTTLVKLGSGSTLPGYYMYHGGTNPEGQRTTLMESQATGYWNDLPVKNYDFQAPLGQYGQVRTHYHLLRRLHLFLHEWGAQLAHMPTTLPDQRPQDLDDVTTLRWAVRSDGTNGFVFINNYERRKALPAKEDVQFTLKLAQESLTFPDEPVTVARDARFFWPFNLDLGHKVIATWATMQPICAVNDKKLRTVFFAQTAGITPKIAVGQTVHTLKPGRAAALELPGEKGTTVRIVVLGDRLSTRLWKGTWKARERVFLSPADLTIDGDTLHLSATDPESLIVGVCPAPLDMKGRAQGVFTWLTTPSKETASYQAGFESVQPAGPLRTIALGKISTPVAEMPSDADFEQAAVWRITLPKDIDLDLNPILRLHYVGDVARVMLNDTLITDDFYNGRPLDIGLRRYAPEILTGDLKVLILPLQKDAPIYWPDRVKATFGEAKSISSLNRVEIICHAHTAFE